MYEKEVRCIKFLTGENKHISLMRCVKDGKFVDNFGKDPLDDVKNLENLALVYSNPVMLRALIYVYKKTDMYDSRYPSFMYLFVSKLECCTDPTTIHNFPIYCIDRPVVSYEDIVCLSHLNKFELTPKYVSLLLQKESDNTVDSEKFIEAYVKLFKGKFLNEIDLRNARNWIAADAIKYICGNYNKTKSAKSL